MQMNLVTLASLFGQMSLNLLIPFLPKPYVLEVDAAMGKNMLLRNDLTFHGCDVAGRTLQIAKINNSTLSLPITCHYLIKIILMIML